MAPDPKTILIVDDDPGICGLLSDYLEDQGFRVRSFSTCAGAREFLREGETDLLVLDLKLPDENGLVFLQKFRMTTETPVIMLTGVSDEADRIVGLELGADDYVTKPFSPRELLARVRAILRRSSPDTLLRSTAGGGNQEEFCFNGWTLKIIGRKLISPDGTETGLSNNEFNLLRALCQNMNVPMSRQELIDFSRVSGDEIFDRSIDVLVYRLRQKIEPDPAVPTALKTVRNVGYVLCGEQLPGAAGQV